MAWDSSTNSLQAPVRRNMTCICYSVVDFFLSKQHVGRTAEFNLRNATTWLTWRTLFDVFVAFR